MQPAFVVTPALDSYTANFTAWVDRVAQHVRSRLGLELEALPELPLREGFEVGHSPAEFYVGEVIDHARAAGHEHAE
jgi:hypothetical protein